MSTISSDHSYNLDNVDNKENKEKNQNSNKIEIILQKTEIIEQSILNIERKIDIICKIYETISKYIEITFIPIKYIINRFK